VVTREALMGAVAMVEEMAVETVAAD